MSLINTARAAFVALLLAISGLALASCGGEDPQKLVDQTFSQNHNVKSGKLNFALNLAGQGSSELSKPIQVSVSGPFESQGSGKVPKFDLSLRVNAQGQSFNAGAVSTGSAGFVKWQGTAYDVGSSAYSQFQQLIQRANSQAQADKKKGGSGASALGIDPRTWLREVKTEGDEQVGGADTTHVSAKVDVPKLLDDVNQGLAKARAKGLPQAGQLPTSLTPQQRKQVTDAVKGATFDFWTGKDDKILRRLAIKLNFQVPKSEQASARGLTGGQLSFDMQLADVNKPQSVSAPANARPISDLTSQLGSLGLGGLGGLGGASGSTSGSPSGTSSGSNAKAQEYLRCVQQAGGDIAKAQRCRSLLGG